MDQYVYPFCKSIGVGLLLLAAYYLVKKYVCDPFYKQHYKKYYNKIIEHIVSNHKSVITAKDETIKKGTMAYVILKGMYESLMKSSKE